jgi:hypothetical protein
MRARRIRKFLTLLTAFTASAIVAAPAANAATASAFVAAPAANAAKYSCQQIHCYAVKFGATSSSTANLNLTLTARSKGGNGFLNHEMWWTSPDQKYWVEVGVMAYRNTEFLFWADSRPGDCQQWDRVCRNQSPPGTNFHQHWGPALRSADYGTPIHLWITRLNGDTWRIGARTKTIGFSGLSTHNPFIASRTQAGLELWGASGASAPPSFFSLTGISTFQPRLPVR